jgi:hypothetical protein
MSDVGKVERITQNRVVQMFRDELDYRYLGNWEEREGNSNIEETLLQSYLAEAGYSMEQISRALDSLRREANNPSRTLYANNQAVYSKLRYGVDIQTGAGQKHEKVWLINWEEPEKNHFAIAEEVTLHGNHERRPDVAIYVNGIALGVLELKRSTVSIGDGIRQAISNQSKEFNEWFYPTVQFVMAGNDSEGLRYGTIGTPEKYFLKWKEDEDDNSRFKLDKYLLKVCEKRRFLELIRDFIVFDAGVKKLPRHHQYFGIKLAQERAKELRSGIIWHTQGSGKSIVMVLLAQWILENNPNARVCIITDRDELDKQIKDVFAAAGHQIYRTSSGRDLMAQLEKPENRLLCSLVHKFGRRTDDFDAFIAELKANPRPVTGEVFVFVDECHRTQSGKLNKAMKALLPGAVFIGFTGTPLLRRDKQTTMEVFGSYIHTYKFNEAVEDEVILVDDGSTDGLTTKLEGKIWPFPFRFRRLEKNQGAPVARNLGFKESVGDEVIFLDADADLVPTALEKMHAALAAHPDAAFAYPSFKFGSKLFKGRPFDVEFLKRKNYIHTSALMRRSAFPGFDESLKKFQDWDLWLTIAEKGGKGVWIDEVLFTLKPRENGMSRWVPKVLFWIPWDVFGYLPAEVKKYRDAEEIVMVKHGYVTEAMKRDELEMKRRALGWTTVIVAVLVAGA